MLVAITLATRFGILCRRFAVLSQVTFNVSMVVLYKADTILYRMLGTLTTHAILKGVGVGSDIASPLSATITWVLKEGAGHFGKILFAWLKG